MSSMTRKPMAADATAGDDAKLFAAPGEGCAAPKIKPAARRNDISPSAYEIDISRVFMKSMTRLLSDAKGRR